MPDVGLEQQADRTLSCMVGSTACFSTLYGSWVKHTTYFIPRTNLDDLLRGWNISQKVEAVYMLIPVTKPLKKTMKVLPVE